MNVLKSVGIVLVLFMMIPRPAAAQEEPTYTERYRPQFHFTPAVNWMNDPNGLVYYNGEYHLFYQYNPFGDTWGHMSWGHAVSRDLVHWEHLPVAIPEVDNVMAFSGSAVVDWNNTTGFGEGGRPPMVAIYTGHYTDERRQAQYIAYSTDSGRTWTPYEGNPVLDRDMADFRDPKVFWYEPDEAWVMVLALPTEHKVSFYRSPNLKEWEHLSDFGPAGALTGIWECPDLFELPVDGSTGNTRWVLQVDLNPGHVAGGSGGQYFIGSFDGTTFTPEEPYGTEPHWVDYGRDYYAAQSWSGLPEADGRRIWLAWMSNWAYAGNIPTAPWRSAMSLPRRVMLRSINGHIQLIQQPVLELGQLRRTQYHIGDLAIMDETVSLAEYGIEGKTLELVAEFEVGDAQSLGLKIRTGREEETLIGYDTEQEEVFVDRAKSGDVDFHEAFPSRDEGPLRIENGRLKLHIFVDHSSVEVFAGDGETVLTERIFPDPSSEGVALFSEGGTARLVSLDVWNLDSAWKQFATRASSSDHP